MKITISKESLLDSLQKVFTIVPQKPTLPVLSNFLLRVSYNDTLASPGILTISGTDMDISITTSVPCIVIQDGSLTVNAKRFLGVIRELPEGDVNIYTENDAIIIDFKNGSSKILCMPSEDYPALRDTIEGIEVSLSGNDFVEMVEKTAFSVSQDRTRLSLTGIYWRVSPDQMTMVSTDGHRLSLFGRKMSVAITDTSEIIIHPKTVNQAAQIVSGGSDLKKIIFGTGVIMFDFGNTIIFSKLIEGPYPNFRQVIPLSNSKKVYMSTEELEAAVRRVSVLSNSITHLVKITVSFGEMELASKNEDIGGESRETVPVRYSGDSMTAGYNATFLTEILRRIESDEILLEFESPTTACIVKPVSCKETDEYIYLIMPLRLSD